MVGVTGSIPVVSTTNFRWLACVEGQYHNPVRIVAFNTAEGWSRDVTVEIADELRPTLRRVWRGTRRNTRLDGDQPALGELGMRNIPGEGVPGRQGFCVRECSTPPGTR